MRIQVSLAFAFSLLLVIQGISQERVKKDIDKLQGASPVSMQDDGKTLPDASKTVTFVVKGNHYVLKGKNDVYQGQLKLDGTGRPKLIDASFVDSDGKEKGRAVGIYELKDDQLRICWRDKGDQRPNSFTSKPGSGTRLIVLRRDK